MGVAKAIALVAGGLHERNLRLQPWRYLSEVGRGLARHGHLVTLVSDGATAPRREWLAGLPLLRLPGLRPAPLHGLAPLKQALEEIQPGVVLWNLGLTSLLYQDFELYPDAVQVGIFTSPIYSFREMARLGAVKLFNNRSLSAVHLAGALLPATLLRQRLAKNGLVALVTQTHTTRWQLLKNGLWRHRIVVIPPGVDDAWRQISIQEIARVRTELDFSPQDFVVAYFGSPAELRGLPTLLAACELARQTMPALRLLVLSRRRESELHRADGVLARLARQNNVRLVDGYLEPAELACYVAAADLVALPFELVPSDAPLSVLEAQVLGKPVVATRVACLPEMVSGEAGCLAQPGDARSLAAAIERTVKGLPDRPGRKPGEHDSMPDRGWQAVGEEWSQFLQTV